MLCILKKTVIFLNLLQFVSGAHSGVIFTSKMIKIEIQNPGWREKKWNTAFIFPGSLKMVLAGLIQHSMKQK